MSLPAQKKTPPPLPLVPPPSPHHHAEKLRRIFRERADSIKAEIQAGHSEDDICAMLPYNNNSIRRYIRKLAAKAAKAVEATK